MSDTNHKVISLEYNLFRDSAEGEQIETTVGKDPLVFLSGKGMMLPDFEVNVVPLNTGDTFSFGINMTKPTDQDQKRLLSNYHKTCLCKKVNW